MVIYRGPFFLHAYLSFFRSTCVTPFSFRRSTLLRVSCIQTHGRPCRPFAWYATFFVCVLLLFVFCISIPPTRQTLLAGIRWSFGRAMFCLRPSRLRTKTSKRDSSKYTWSSQVWHIFLMKPVSLGFLCLGLGNLQKSRIGLVRSNRVLMSGRFSLSDHPPRKLPARQLMPLYTKSDREVTFEGMLNQNNRLIRTFNRLFVFKS